MRCFCALELPAAVRKALAAAAAPLRGLGDVKWVGEDHLHVTLKFLGEIAEPQIAAMRAAIAGPWPVLSLRLAGLGQFPKHGAPRVLWAGLAGDVQALAEVAARLETAAAAVGVPKEARPFAAHVTLGRCKTPAGSARLQSALREHGPSVASEPFAAAAVVLFRSELGPQGSVYTALARAGFGG